MSHSRHHIFMGQALDLAQHAFDKGEVPVGAVVVDTSSGEIIGRGYNQTRALSDPTAHAEILALRQACAYQGSQRLEHCDLYVTLEPCPMCAPAIAFARIERLFYGANDPKSGGLNQGTCCYDHAVIHHHPHVIEGVMADEATSLLKKFFDSLR